MTLAKKVHTILGLSTLFLLVIEHALGMVTQYFQEDPSKPAKYFRAFQLTHRIAGCSLYVITKVEIMNGWWIYKKSKTLVLGIMMGWFTLLLLAATMMEYLYRSGKLQKALDCFGFRRNDMSKFSSVRETLIRIN